MYRLCSQQMIIWPIRTSFSKAQVRKFGFWGTKYPLSGLPTDCVSVHRASNHNFIYLRRVFALLFFITSFQSKFVTCECRLPNYYLRRSSSSRILRMHWEAPVYLYYSFNNIPHYCSASSSSSSRRTKLTNLPVKCVFFSDEHYSTMRH